MTRCQQSISQPAHVTGFGYWSGKDVTVEFRPAPEGAGITFVRTDLPSRPRIPADVALRLDVPLRTCLLRQNAQVEMVEHVLAALAGLRIDNCEVWVGASEMPGCDGSSSAFASALSQAGIVSQDEERRRLVVERTLRVGDESAWVEAHPLPEGGQVIQYRLDYGPGPIGQQEFRVELTPESFCRELAPARTFLLEADARWLREQGYGRRVTNQDLLVFDRNGPIENALRFPNECARHKALDLVGDLSLAGCELQGHFVAYRSGHRLNAELVRCLLAAAPQPELRQTV